jgi:hypothetical protein
MMPACEHLFNDLLVVYIHPVLTKLESNAGHYKYMFYCEIRHNLSPLIMTTTTTTTATTARHIARARSELANKILGKDGRQNVRVNVPGW